MNSPLFTFLYAKISPKPVIKATSICCLIVPVGSLRLQIMVFRCGLPQGPHDILVNPMSPEDPLDIFVTLVVTDYQFPSMS